MTAKAQICALICTLSTLTNQYNSFSNKLLATQPPQAPTYERFRTKDYVRNFNLFMQNKPNFQKPKMTINYYTQRTYKNFHFLELLKNKPKQTQS